MVEVYISYPTPEGSHEIAIDRDRVTFGRGSDVDHRFEDQSLSRLHATVYRDGDRVWIVDENSSNGTSVNGSPVQPAGTPLSNGDSIRLGNNTVLNVRFVEASVTPAAAKTPMITSSAGAAPSGGFSASPMTLLPIALIAVAFLIVSVSAVVIGFKMLGPPSSSASLTDEDIDDDPIPEYSPKPEATKTADAMPTKAVLSDPSDDKLPIPEGTPVKVDTAPAKPYLSMSDAEKREYIRVRAMRMAQVIGNRASDEIPSEAVDKIKSFTDAYASRIKVKPLGGCRFGDNLEATYTRASKNAPFIVRAFNEKGIDPRIGLYLAMIESEHCVCLQSPTGPLGMFQFTKATGELHGLKTVRGASPSNPDERCEPEPSARAAASYMKALTGRYGTGPASVPLAIGSYNSGEGGLSTNLVKALESNSGLPRDFWTLISKGEILSKQFQSENFKYVPKFFAAAIVGENPADFGMKLQPLST
ncbi:MAG TPA: FHA domain-containing protein, partial [Pyrinomonadaceae bacterium]|nr:FHA domain-containing protein [Pyrinomonadaceae bacterium]